MSEINRRMNSRLNRKKKSNTILNVLIGIVLLLIIVTVVNIVKDDGKKETAVEQTTPNSSEEQKEETEEKSSDAEVEDSSNVDPSTEGTGAQHESSTDTNASSTEEESETNVSSEQSNNDSITTEQSSDPNVEEVIVDSSWQPIGTTQTGSHVSSYDQSSVDWKEKVEALSYASGLDSSNMFIKFLGNGGSPQKSIGTITSKDGKEIYRISLEWVDGQGWKPTQKEKLRTLEDAS